MKKNNNLVKCMSSKCILFRYSFVFFTECDRALSCIKKIIFLKLFGFFLNHASHVPSKNVYVWAVIEHLLTHQHKGGWKINFYIFCCTFHSILLMDVFKRGILIGLSYFDFWFRNPYLELFKTFSLPKPLNIL